MFFFFIFISKLKIVANVQQESKTLNIPSFHFRATNDVHFEWTWDERTIAWSQTIQLSRWGIICYEKPDRSIINCTWPTKFDLVHRALAHRASYFGSAKCSMPYGAHSAYGFHFWQSLLLVPFLSWFTIVFKLLILRAEWTVLNIRSHNVNLSISSSVVRPL